MSRRFIHGGMERSGTRLREEIEFYLVSVFSNYMSRPCDPDNLTIRLFRAIDGRMPSSQLRQIAEDCLIACSFFESRLKKTGGTLYHYAGIGRNAYEEAGMTEQAWSFPHMRDVLVFAQGDKALSIQDLLREAREGSPASRKHLEDRKVVIFRRAPARFA